MSPRTAVLDRVPRGWQNGGAPPEIAVSLGGGGWLFSAVVLFLAGCSSSGPTLAEVTGSVTFNGHPAHAEVTFEPQSSGAGASVAGGGRVSSTYTRPDG